MTVPTESLKIWAKSLSGCDGGNPDAPVWLCGIEWGGGGINNGIYYRTKLKSEIEAGVPQHAGDTYDWLSQSSHRFGRSFSKIYTAFKGHEVNTYKSFIKSLNGREVFKLNLYPIAFDSTDEAHWHDYGLEDITGFSHKHLFNLWCEHHRFPHFAKLRSNHSPKLIVCCGLNYLGKFLQFFGAAPSDVASLRIVEIPCTSNSSRNSPRRMYVTKLGKDTTFACIPFFTGSYGLNSDQMLQFVGDNLREFHT